MQKIIEKIKEKLEEKAYDEAISIVDQVAKEYMNAISKCSNCSRRKFYQEGYEDGRNAYRWIFCDVELPEELTDVLLQDEYGTIDIGYCKILGDITTWSTDFTPIAWRPLPKALNVD